MPPIASVDVPASSANLGSGFDCFAVALSLKLRAELWYGDELGITLNARGEGAPAEDDRPDDNLLLRAFREGLRVASGPGSESWRIEVSSMIPSARGLGSSASAIVAGLVLGASVGRRTIEADELLALAAGLEGHPDNVAAALYGGFTLALADDGEVRLRRFRVPEAWIPVAFIPQRESRTHEMRGALPASVPHDVATRQAGRAALLTTAIMTSDAGLLRPAMADELHQPHGCLSSAAAASSSTSRMSGVRPAHACPAPGRPSWPSATRRQARTPSRRPGTPLLEPGPPCRQAWPRDSGSTLPARSSSPSSPRHRPDLYLNN